MHKCMCAVVQHKVHHMSNLSILNDEQDDMAKLFSYYNEKICANFNDFCSVFFFSFCFFEIQ